jgi:CRP-like cAMP-binding protein
MPNRDRTTYRNKLLLALPKDESQQLRPHLEQLTLQPKQVLYDSSQPIEYIYFLQSGLASLLIRMENDSFVEAVTVGHEAMIGLSIFLGVDQLPWQACWQSLPGDALRIKVSSFKRILQTTMFLPVLLQRYTQTLLNQIVYLSVCNHQHSIREVFCRWLLTALDRAGGDEVCLTQNFLAQLLGVRRASISPIAASLQRQGILHYSRGRIQILHRAGLEAQVCECYAKIKHEYDLLLHSYKQFRFTRDFNV